VDEQSYDLQTIVSNNTDSALYIGICNTLTQARTSIYAAFNSAMVEAYWDIGTQIENGAICGRVEYGSNSWTRGMQNE